MNRRDDVRLQPSAQEPDTAEQVRERMQPAETHPQQAALSTLLEFAGRAHPPFSLEELHASVLNDFARQLSEHDDPGRLQAVAQKLVRAFWALADLDPAPTETLTGLKQVLGAALRSVDENTRDILVTHCLEPLFESRRIAAMFADWEDDAQLHEVYQRALAWGEGFWPHTRGG